jgi:tripartite-type tricarboxylate transporter receptor subunit TctC
MRGETSQTGNADPGTSHCREGCAPGGRASRRTSGRVMAILMVFGSLATAAAQDYPTMSVRFVVGYPAGSPPDLTARVVGSRMSQILGQQFVIENKTGAGSNLAAAMVARAPKDGYTLYMGSSANPINAVFQSNASIDFIKDFAPITLLASTPSVLSVSPALGVKSVRELIDLARAKPATIAFGSSGVGSSTHLSLELFKSLAQIDIVHVPYAGSPKAVIDLLAGRIQGMFSPSATVIPHVKDGTLIALASTDRKRTSVGPDLPTMAEAGVPNFEAVLWFGLMAPSGVSDVILDKLARAANEPIKSEEVVNTLQPRDVQLIGGTREEFARYINEEMARWSDVVIKAGLGK